MIETGNWKGQYKYDKQVYQEMIGFDHTNFEIEITKVDNNNFIGKVQDDLTTGGTEGIGEIKGKVTGDKVEFVKQMPVLTVLIEKTEQEKHSIKIIVKYTILGRFPATENQSLEHGNLSLDLFGLD